MKPMQSVFAQRFNELADSFNTMIPFKQDHHSGYETSPYALAGDWKRWATSAQSLIRASYGESAPHYVNFVNAFRRCEQAEGNDKVVMELRGVFLAAKDDFDGGYVFNVDLRVSGEVFGDFVTLANQAMSEGHKDVAAVLACAALEDALKRYAVAQGLDASDLGMEDNVNLLKAQGLVGGSMKSLLATMPKIRNAAMHAQWDKIGAPDVASVIGFVEQFLLTKFDEA